MNDERPNEETPDGIVAHDASGVDAALGSDPFSDERFGAGPVQIEAQFDPSTIRCFYVVRNRKRLGPYTETQLIDMVTNDVLDPHDLAIRDGLTTFLPISSLVELERALEATAADGARTGVDPSIDIRQVYVTHEGRRIGPFTLVQVQQLVRNGMLSPNDPAIYQGCIKSLPLASLLASIDRAVTRTQKLVSPDATSPRDTRRQAKRQASSRGRKPAPWHVAVLIALAVLTGATVLIAILATTGKLPPILGVKTLRVEAADPPSMCLSTALVKQFIAVQGYRNPSVTSGTTARTATFDDGWVRRRIDIVTADGVGAEHRGFDQHVVGFDAVVVVVHPSNGIGVLTTDQVAAILRGELTDWSRINPLHGGAIAVHVRDTLSRVATGVRETLPSAQPFTPRAHTHGTDRAVDDAVSADSNAFGIVSFVSSTLSKKVALGEPGAVVAYPSSFTIRTEDYPLSRRLTVRLPSGWRERLARGLGRFMHTPAAHAAVEAHGVIAPRIEIVYPSITWPAPDRYRDLAEGAGRVTAVIRFEHNTLRPDAKAHRDVARISDMLSEPENRGIELVLIGFWSPLQSKRVAIRASRHAAKQVAKLFSLHGITPAEAEGFGAIHLLASDNSPEGQVRNRRVEIWVRER